MVFQIEVSPTTRHWSQYTDRDLATSSSTTPSSTESPTRDATRQTERCCAAGADGDGSPCRERKARTHSRNGPSIASPARKSCSPAVTRRFALFSGRLPTAIARSSDSRALGLGLGFGVENGERDRRRRRRRGMALLGFARKVPKYPSTPLQIYWEVCCVKGISGKQIKLGILFQNYLEPLGLCDISGFVIRDYYNTLKGIEWKVLEECGEGKGDLGNSRGV